MSRWPVGVDVIQRMLDLIPPHLQKVHPDREHADMLIEQARAHLTSSSVLAESDPEGAYALLYDAARKALTAILENQGLRPTSKGGHLAVYEATMAQLENVLRKTLRPFDRMRRRRQDAEYPATDAEPFTSDDVAEDLPKATEIVEAAAKLLDQMSPF